jgi:hypothetical protein
MDKPEKNDAIIKITKSVCPFGDISRVTRNTMLDPNTKIIAINAMLRKSHCRNFSIS